MNAFGKIRFDCTLRRMNSSTTKYHDSKSVACFHLNLFFKYLVGVLLTVYPLPDSTVMKVGSGHHLVSDSLI